MEAILKITGALDLVLLPEAASDFRFLLARGYPRGAALELVGNRYGLYLVPKLNLGTRSDVAPSPEHEPPRAAVLRLRRGCALCFLLHI